jgi:hypothetical protein
MKDIVCYLKKNFIIIRMVIVFITLIILTIILLKGCDRGNKDVHLEIYEVIEDSISSEIIPDTTVIMDFVE